MALDWERIRIFKAICDAGSLTAAARSLGVGQSRYRSSLGLEELRLRGSSYYCLVSLHRAAESPWRSGLMDHLAVVSPDQFWLGHISL